MLIGLTGVLASGKSTVAEVLAERGAHVIDADELARKVVEPGTPGLEEIRKVFGDSVIGVDGRLDRKALAGLVFEDDAKRRELEGIVHPRVGEAMAERIEAIREEEGRGEDEPVIVLNVPLLLEAGLDAMVDRVVVVRALEEQSIARAQARNGMSEDEARRRLAAQWPLGRKLTRADDIIDNSGPLEATRLQAIRLYNEWKRNPCCGAPGR